jgi:glycosyltransferase involved in cell wall biosynthesis
MIIIYLHQYFNTPDMPGGTRSYEMARRMVKAGHSVHIITSFREEKPPRKEWFQTDEEGIQVHWYPVRYSNSMGFVNRIKAFFTFALAARKKALEIDADLIFATSTPLTIALPAIPAARKKNIPLVFEVRDLWPEMPIAIGALKHPVLRYFAKKLEYWAYHSSEAVVALSPGMKEGVMRTGYPANRIGVIPNGSDNIEFSYDIERAARFRSKREWLGDAPLLVYAGTFGQVNGVVYMVELAKALLDIGSDIKIILVGDGSEREGVISAAKSSNVYEVNLFIEPPLPKKEIASLFSAATMASNLVIDLPEARANSANKFFDTLASGRPVFLNHGGWMHDIVNKKECGLAMWGVPIKEVAKILDVKMHDLRWLEESGQAARKLAEEYFARDILAKQLMDILKVASQEEGYKAEAISPGNYA